MHGGETNEAGAALPTFCDQRVVFAAVVVAELLVCVVALSSAGQGLGTWRGFTLTSLFAQWVALTAVSLLCVARPYLARTPTTLGLCLAWLLVLAVTLAGALAAWWLDHRFELGLTATGGSLGGFLLVTLSLSALVTAAALRYLHIQSEWERRLRAEAQARIQALQARIRPHFLFNSMNTIASLIRSQPEAAEAAVEDLADLFRGALKERADTDLATELALVRQYLKLEALRLGTRLQIHWALDDLPGDARVPPLSLQPLVENAIYHGIQPVPEGGMVAITGHQRGKRIEIAVENPLPPQGAQARREGNRMAQDNIAQRMQLYFGSRAGLRVAQTHNRYRVTLHFPYHTKPVSRHARFHR